ncbi:MAG TPA: cysteine synthase family protein, partial [Thermoanaerobaculia bacterium]
MQIGNTPLIRLNTLPGAASAEVFVKWEGANPTGSMKDRMALSMIEGAEARGALAAGGRVVEYTGGSTGSSLAMVCAGKGYRAHFVSSDAFAEEKLQTMRAFGAQLELIPSVGRKVTPDLVQNGIRRVKELVAEGGTFWTDQFNNPDNRAGYAPMAREILAALDGRLDEFVMSVGTGGCFSGNAEVFKEQVAGVRCTAVEPAASRALSGQGPYGGHRLEGIGIGFVTSITRLDLADSIVAVRDEDAFATARRLAREEG